MSESGGSPSYVAELLCTINGIAPTLELVLELSCCLLLIAAARYNTIGYPSVWKTEMFEALNLV